MLHSVYSNSYEVLREILVSHLDAQQPESVFETIPIIVPSYAVGIDLQRYIAHKRGICSAIDFRFLANWMWGYLQKTSGVTFFNRLYGPELVWRIWTILGDESFLCLPQSERLSRYLKDNSEINRFTLAQHIAATFVVYGSYRLDWLLGWQSTPPKDPDSTKEERTALQQHPDYFWQKELWRRLAHDMGLNNEHPGATFLRMTDPQSGAPLCYSGTAIHVFMPQSVPPVFLQMIARLANDRDIWLYLLNPCQEYWFDLVPPKLFDWPRVSHDELHREIAHPLLASCGLSTKANIDRLWRFTAGGWRDEMMKCAMTEEVWPTVNAFFQAPRTRQQLANVQELSQKLKDLPDDMQAIYLPSHSDRLLDRLQDSILMLDTELLPEEVAPGDRSIEIHEAHSLTRELEALQDTLYEAFNEDPTLQAHDVLVVTPDIVGAAPLIDAVFGRTPSSRRLPWRITGLAEVDINAEAQTLLALGTLLQGRVRLEDFQQFISLPIISKAFDLSAEQINRVMTWLFDAGFGFGLSDEHLKSLGAKFSDVDFFSAQDMTLIRALERLTLGMAINSDVLASFGDVAPVEGNRIEYYETPVYEEIPLLNRIAELALILDELRRGCVSPRSAESWMGWVDEVLLKIFRSESKSASMLSVRQRIGELVDSMTAAGGDLQTFSFDLFWTALRFDLTARAPAGKPSNKITFSEISQMRGLPYRIIAVVGLNEDASFPGNSRAEEFDLIPCAPRRGDRDRKRDNRNVFLDLILCARDRLILSYCARNVQDNSLKNPSVLISELIELLLKKTQGDKDKRERFLKAITLRYPLQSFSSQLFDTSPKENFDVRRLSHDETMCCAVKKAIENNYSKPETPFSKGAVRVLQREKVVDVDELARVLQKPATAMLKGFGIVSTDIVETEDVEGWAQANTLGRYLSSTEMLDALLNDKTRFTALKERWLHEPRFGFKGYRDIVVTQLMQTHESVKERLFGEDDFEHIPPFDVSHTFYEGELKGWTLKAVCSIAYKNSVGDMKLMVALPGKSTSRGAVAAKLLHWLMLAQGYEVTLSISCALEAKLSVSPVFSADYAHKMLAQLCESYLAIEQGALLLLDGALNQALNPTDELLWRARSQSRPYVKNWREAKDSLFKVVANPKNDELQMLQGIDDALSRLQQSREEALSERAAELAFQEIDAENDEVYP